MVYIALLRGINVGGNNKISMKTLKEVFEQAGMIQVKTYINSGNIIFTSFNHSKEELVAILETAIFEHFELQIKVLLVSEGEFRTIAAAVPENWTNGDQMKSDVLFLWEDVDSESVLDRLVVKPEIDHILYVPGAILWAVDRDKVTRSGMMKLAGSELYKHMTVRNVNTVRKLVQLIEK
ncbi:DUF1697 domain-containing protein [Planococcus sp. YIM B11945]|uniref:DUF1697 domain-containing protein n=1 Tax=Planococcus sp. YIM B11945 TaxID=3435410 RepID=UPI003D7DE7CB